MPHGEGETNGVHPEWRQSRASFTGNPPRHLDYKQELLTLSSTTPYAYMIVPYWFYDYYQYRFPTLPNSWRFNYTDALSLVNSPSVSVIYSNNMFTVWVLETS